MYKVFFNNNTLILSNNKSIIENPDRIYAYKGLKELSEFIFEECQKFENNTVLIHNDNIDLLWKNFKKLFKIKVAGGGVVINNNNEILFIKRRCLWDLPKGHQEKDEEIEVTAIREVQEECGIKILKIVKPLQPTYHTYWLKNKPILKPTFWFLMNYSGAKTGKPQLEEEITEIRWFNKNDVKTALENTFPSIINTINDCFANREL